MNETKDAGAVGGRLPTRAEVASLRRGELWRKRPAKADLLLLEIGGSEVVVKDFAAKGWWTRLVGRLQVARECRAYRYLGPHPYLPRYFGRVDAHALAIERIHGVQLSLLERRFADRRRHLGSIRRMMESLLEQGFAHLDLRGRYNLMAADDGRLVAIDLAGAFWWPPHRPGGLLFQRVLRWYYWKTLRKWRKLLTPGRSARDERGPIRRAWDRVRMPHRWFGPQGEQSPPVGRHDPAPGPATTPADEV